MLGLEASTLNAFLGLKAQSPKTLSPSSRNWVAVRQLKVTYHNGYVYVHIYIYMYSNKVSPI